MVFLVVVAVCLVAASVLTVAAVILSSRLNQDVVAAPWSPDEPAANDEAPAPGPEQPVA